MGEKDARVMVGRWTEIGRSEPVERRQDEQWQIRDSRGSEQVGTARLKALRAQ